MSESENVKETGTDVYEAEAAKAAISELIEGASIERLQAMRSLLSLSDARAVTYGDALSLIIDTDYNIGALKQAIQKIKDEQGLMTVRTRTAVRVFKYLKDEDNPDSGYVYRGFYVKTVTPEQKIAIGVGKADKFKEMIGSGFTEKDIANKPKKMLEFLNSDAFKSLMTEPNKAMRKIVLENMVEVKVGSDGNVKIPQLIFLEKDIEEVEEFVLQQLEEDLAMLIEQQGILAKNSLMTDI